MAKTTLPSKQLELPIMVELKQQVEHRAHGTVPAQPSPVAHKAGLHKQVNEAEATAVDLSIYDAISSNYSRLAK